LHLLDTGQRGITMNINVVQRGAATVGIGVVAGSILGTSYSYLDGSQDRSAVQSAAAVVGGCAAALGGFALAGKVARSGPMNGASFGIMQLGAVAAGGTVLAVKS